MTVKHQKDLLLNKTSLGIWGSGYIGFTSAINFALKGVRVVCYDTNKEIVDSINRGEVRIPNLEYWIGFSVKPLVKEGLLRATSNWKDLTGKDVRAHLVAIPTERGGDPWDGPLKDVVGKLASKPAVKDYPELVIIESTLTPNLIEDAVVPILEASGRKAGKDFLIAVAPRRDWFHSPEKNLKNLKRVVGGVDKRSTEVAAGVLGIVSDHILKASNHKVAELVKSVENSLLHVPAVYAMQLARAYPSLDINEVLELASTHWRIPRYYPTMGTGGYCIPVSSKYVVQGAEHPEFLTMAQDAIRFDADQAAFVAGLAAAHAKGGKVGVLGIAYKADLKVHTLSPAISIIRNLTERGIRVLANDPYYTTEEINSLTGVESFDYPDGLKGFKVVVIVPEHRLYTQTPKSVVLKSLRKGQIIIDNTGAWESLREEFREKGVTYHKIGDSGWCKR
ncbi:MAG: nucleotide sugar dehydrogenase [Nitrospirae bacterium]|nr:nucleotide sugar dehydrogenase [Nitrospirota bacterium]MBI5694220.1 nucleotide sugar dehydrogenase [Nitrospirota bacterium]